MNEMKGTRAAATNEQLFELLSALLTLLLKELRGEPSAAMLDVARKLLRDNGVQLTALEARNPRKALETLAHLTKEMPSFEDEESGK